MKQRVFLGRPASAGEYGGRKSSFLHSCAREFRPSTCKSSRDYFVIIAAQYGKEPGGLVLKICGSNLLLFLLLIIAAILIKNNVVVKSCNLFINNKFVQKLTHTNPVIKVFIS